MSFFHAVLYRIRGLVRPELTERELDSEFAFHMEMEMHANENRGLSSNDAADRARRDFGHSGAVRDELRDARGAGAIAGMTQDARYALRRVWRERGFSALVVLTLALGIGWTIAIASVVDTALVRPLGYASPNELVHLWARREGSTMNKGELAPAEVRELTASSNVFAAVGAYRQSGVTLALSGDPEPVSSLRVSSSVLPLLGVRPSLGRNFDASDDVPGAAMTALITDEMWRTRFGGEASAVGRVVTIDGAAATIIGVLPADFRFVLASTARVLTPIQLDPASTDRGNRWVRAIGRLRPGISFETAQREFDAIVRRMAAEYPDASAGRAGNLLPLREEMVGNNRAVLLALMIGVVALLMMGCANVAGLLLSRVAGRASELAIRRALGANVTRIISQIVIENLIIAAVGGIAGIGVAYLALRVLLAQVPGALLAAFPFIATATIDARLIAIGTLVSVATGLLCAAMPTIAAASHAPAGLLRSGGRAVSAPARWRLGLLSAQLALTFTLVACSSMLGRSLAALFRTDLGFRSENLLTFGVPLNGPRYASAQARGAAFGEIERRLAALPRVEGVAMGSALPLEFGIAGAFVLPHGTSSASDQPYARVRFVAPGYFEALGIPIQDGRSFTSADTIQGSGVIVSAALMRQYASRGARLGGTLGQSASTQVLIVGVAGDVRIAVDEEAPPTIYAAAAPSGQTFLRFAVRTRDDPAAITPSVRRVLSSVDPQLAGITPRSMRQAIDTSRPVFFRRFPLLVIGVFSVVGIVLAAVGLFGAIAYSVTQRTREFGIRMALGASRASVVGLSVREGLGATVVGIVAGVGLMMFASRALSSLLYGVKSADVISVLGTVGVILLTALLAALIPARRAVSIPPSSAMRDSL